MLSQTFSDFEFIIIDDGSTDKTWESIRSFSDSRIIAIRNEKNIGNYPSRNIGMRRAQGKYIAVMDGDDVALPDRLWKQYHYMEEHPNLLALGTQFDFLGLKLKIEKPVSYEKICAALLDNNCFLHPSLLIRTDAMKQLNGYNEEYIYSSDYDLVCRLSLIGKIENLQDTCMLYRWHSAQISQKKALVQRDFADDIRQKYQIAYINKNKPKDFPEVGVAETGHPAIGRIIGLYIMGKHLNLYQEMADNLLDFMIDNIDSSMPLCLKNGLLGIGMGLIYLLRNNLVEGDENEVLESIDALALNPISFFENTLNFDSTEISSYLKKRAEIL